MEQDVPDAKLRKLAEYACTWLRDGWRLRTRTEANSVLAGVLANLRQEAAHLLRKLQEAECDRLAVERREQLQPERKRRRTR